MKFTNRKWLANMIQPQVYGDSVSYYEQLNKLTYAMNELYDLVENNLSESAEALIAKFLNDIMADMLYHEDTKNITFTFDKIVGDNYHDYNSTTSTMTIKGD